MPVTCWICLKPCVVLTPQDATSLEFCDDQPNTGARIRQQFEQQQSQHEAQGSQPLKGLRIGVPAQFFGPGLDPVVADAIEAALKTYESLGAERVTVQLPLTELSVPTYYVIGPAEASTNLSRFDGVRFGHRANQYTDLSSMISRSRSERSGLKVVRRILVGTYVLSHGYYDAYYLQAQRVRRMIVDDFQKVFEQCRSDPGPRHPGFGPQTGNHHRRPHYTAGRYLHAGRQPGWLARYFHPLRFQQR